MKTSLAILSILALFAATQAEARDFGRSVNWKNSRGSGSRTVDGSVTRDGASRTATTTTAGGKTVSTSQQVDRTGNGRTVSTSATGPQGKTVTTSGSVTHSDGTRTATRSVTGPEGNTKSVTTTVTRQP